MRAYHYRHWDGTQDLSHLDAKDLMDLLGDKVLDGRDLTSALRDLMQRGARMPSGRNMNGMRDLLERLRERRKEQLQRYNMDSVMDDIKERLEKVIQKEREGIQRRLDENQQNSPNTGDPEADQRLRDMLDNLAKKHLEQLDNLPPQAGGRIQQLRDYDFMDGEAREEFQELLKTLQQQMMEQYFQGLKRSLGGMTPEMMGQMQQMVKDLNRLLEQHRRGDDSGFQDFMDKWGELFPEGMQNVDQLSQHLAQQMGQMQQLLDSMTPEMRQELEDMMSELMGDPGFQDDLMELMMRLDDMHSDARGDRMPFSGDDPITLQEALKLMRDVKGLEDLEQDLIEAARSNNPDAIDPDKIEHLLGEEARRMAEELQDFQRMLEEAGLIRRKGKGWELTPRAMRQIAERALDDIFGRIDRGLTGEHTLSRHGWGIERLEETKPYVFGDAFQIDVQGTVRNALRRDGGGTPVHLGLDDFEVYRSASINQCSTVILLDMSYSMLRNGRFLAGRKVAMALDSLIRSKFPRDVLKIAAFSYFVLPLKKDQLLETDWIDPGGTDFPEALRVGRQMLSGYKEGTKQIILITDGEPHANAFGYDFGRYNQGWSMREAMEETLREIRRCTKDRIVVNTFMLDTEPVMTSFIKAMARLNNGRIFFADPGELGDYLIVDYMKNRRRSA